MRILLGDHRLWEPPNRGAAVTVGVFDGVHRGHAHLIGELGRRAGGAEVTVATFDRHPLELIRPDATPAALTTLEQRLEKLDALGVDTAAVLRFDDELRRMTARDFAADILVRALGARLVLVGTDFRFGRDRAGDLDSLAAIGEELGFETVGLELVGDGSPISSTVIRRLVAAGDVAAAAGALGAPFALRGEVVAGDGRGRSIGVPTANLALPDGIIRPGRGVYAAWAREREDRLPAVVNVGVRPTFDGETETVEAHLLRGGGDLYGRILTLEFVARLRGERRFETVEALVEQIHQDIGAARKLLRVE